MLLTPGSAGPLETYPIQASNAPLVHNLLAHRPQFLCIYHRFCVGGRVGVISWVLHISGMVDDANIIIIIIVSICSSLLWPIFPLLFLACWPDLAWPQGVLGCSRSTLCGMPPGIRYYFYHKFICCHRLQEEGLTRAVDT